MSAFNDCYKSVLSFSKQTFFLPLHCVSNIFVNFAFLFFIENYQVDVVNIKVNTGKMLYETPKRHQNNKMSSQTFIIKIVTILPYCLLWWNYQHCDQFDNMFSFNSQHINKFSQIFFDVFSWNKKDFLEWGIYFSIL